MKLNSKYYLYYQNIISFRKQNTPTGYTETHYILPRSLGGNDDKENLVCLTAREHYVCHLLLTKIYEDDVRAYFKMVKACVMMMFMKAPNQQRVYNSRMYEWVRTQFSKVQSISQTGKNNSQFGKVWVFNLQLQKTKKVDKNEPLEPGWCHGRVINFDSFIKKINFKPIRMKLKSQEAQKFRDEINIKKQELKQQKFLQKQKYYTELYNIYCEYGWKKFKVLTNYGSSQVNFVTQCKKYVKEFTPQNGKKRGKV